MKQTPNIPEYPDSNHPAPFRAGMEFQDYVVEQFNRFGFYIQLHASKKYQFTRGESVQRVEIKLDNRCTDTGRLSIEVGERTSLNTAWVASGIYRNDGTWMYIQGNRNIMYLFNLKYLRRYHEIKLEGMFEEGPQTIRKFYIPFLHADKICIAKIEPQDNGVTNEHHPNT